MKLTAIETGRFRLDGGAMFGIVPKRMWEKMNPPDARNLCEWSMRVLVAEFGDRKILFDTGIGTKQDDRFRSHFEPTEHLLIEKLAEIGIEKGAITDVFLTHLHFDHVGGAVERVEFGDLVPTFPNARYWSNERQFESALAPNAKEKASFLKENFMPLRDAGVLEWLPTENQLEKWLPEIDFFVSYGHTEAMMSPIIRTENGTTIVFCADLLPSQWHIGAPYVMAYDIRPLDTMREKDVFLKLAADNNWVLFFEHDPLIECATVRITDDQRFMIDRTGKLTDFI